MNGETRMKLALPNVDIDTHVQEKLKGMNTRAKTPYVLGETGVSSHIHPLIEKLALKYPQWQFVGSYSACSESTTADNSAALDISVRDFSVYDKRERLGQIELGGYSWRTKTHSFMIGNHRTSAALERATSFKTSNIDKAVKLVGKHFGVKNDMELYVDAYKIANEGLNHQFKMKTGAMRRILSETDEQAFQFMLARWDQFLATIVDTRQRDLLSEVPEMHSEVILLGAMQQKSVTFTIRQEGSYYIMTNEAGGLDKKTNDELPNNVRHKLGILKLVKDGQAVSDVGFRASDNVFLILKDKS